MRIWQLFRTPKHESSRERKIIKTYSFSKLVRSHLILFPSTCYARRKSCHFSGTATINLIRFYKIRLLALNFPSLHVLIQFVSCGRSSVILGYHCAGAPAGGSTNIKFSIISPTKIITKSRPFFHFNWINNGYWQEGSSLYFCQQK